MIGAADRTLGTAEGLRGFWFCPECAELATNPSFLDLGGTGNVPQQMVETEPHSGVDLRETFSLDSAPSEED